MKHTLVKHTLTSAIVATLFLGFHSTSATAAPLTFAPTPTGLTFTIENLGTVADLFAADGNPNDTYAIALTLTTTTNYVGDNELLAAFSLDFSSAALNAATLVSGPAGFTWTLTSNDKVAGNSGGCGGSEPGAVCVEELASPTNNLLLDANATYSWLFNVDLGAAGFGATTVLDVGVGTLKRSGDDFQGSYAFSASTGSLALAGAQQPVVATAPEPGSLVLLGSGLVFAASRVRRRRK